MVPGGGEHGPGWGCSARPRSWTLDFEPLSIPSGKQSVYLFGGGGYMY